MTFSPRGAVPLPNQESRRLAEALQSQLTKPPGSLGQLEDLALQFAAWQANEKPRLDKVCLRVFAADHGVCSQGVSLFPQEVTQQMVHNFSSGGAAISVLARAGNFDFEVWNLGTISPTPDMPWLKNIQITAGSADFTRCPALTEEQLAECLQAGCDSVADCQLFIAGEMGIGNTTSAAALMAALYGLSGADVAGKGTGLDDRGVRHKAEVIDCALALHAATIGDSMAMLRCLGGLEIASIVGAYIAAAQKSIPILVDGFITTVAAAYAVAINPDVRNWMLFAHCSAEQAHQKLLAKLQAVPLLDLGMRLGEATGAAVAVPLIRSAINLHSGMATFADAGVSNSQGMD